MEHLFSRLFIPKTIRSYCGTFVPWTVRSLELSFPGTNEPGPFVPRTIRSLQHSFLIIKSCETSVTFVNIVLQITKRLRKRRVIQEWGGFWSHPNVLHCHCVATGLAFALSGIADSAPLLHIQPQFDETTTVPIPSVVTSSPFIVTIRRKKKQLHALKFQFQSHASNIYISRRSLFAFNCLHSASTHFLVCL